MFLSFLMLTIPLVAHGQQRTRATDGQPDRPKIGLVLSGGGAKGLAHVGVLKAIEKAGLQIDYITGTSMGAIVAAMYASGYNASQIEQFAHTLKWMELISSRPLYSDISIEEKDDFESYLATFPMKGLKPQLNTGFFEPYQVMLMLKEIFFPVYAVHDWRELPIPFRCVAADVASGDAVILDHGDLAFATRSSMAIPGVFSATEYKGTKLVDGGIVRNFPVKDVKDMGADYVIGVNLFSGLTPSDKMTNMLDVMMQTINFRDAKDLQEEKAICDMVIEPDVAAYNASSFDAAETILEIGNQTGEEFYPLFKQLADSLHNAYGVPYAKTDRLAPYDNQVRIIDFQFEGLEHTSESLLRHNLNLRAGHLYTPQDFTAAIKNAMSTGYYKNMTYDLISADEGSVIFHCKVYENPLATLKVDLSYNTFTNASLFLNYQARNLLGSNSTTDLKVAISRNFRFKVKNRLLFGERHNYYFDATYENTRFYLPSQGDAQGIENANKYIHNDLNVRFGHATSARADVNFGLGYECFHYEPDIRETGEISGKVRAPYAIFTRRVNTLDRKYLPQRGMKFDMSLYGSFLPGFHLHSGAMADSLEKQGRLDKKAICRFTARLESYQAVKPRLTLCETFGVALAYNSHTFFHQTALGGVEAHLPSHFNFYGITTAHKHFPTMAMVRFSAQYRVLGDLYGQVHINSALTMKSLDCYVNDKEEIKIGKYLHGGGLTIAYNLLGSLPMDFTLMYSSEDKFNISVNIGHFF